jgi:oligopeptide/dipeptide ABC transporter ATP-binding protein
MLLDVDNLHTEFAPKRRPSVQAVRGVSFSVDKGETLGIVGESGSGKSVTALSIVRLVDAPGRTTQGTVRLAGVDLLSLSEKQMRDVRGARIAFVFQDPMTALNPVLTVGQQMTETIRAHESVSGADAKKAAITLLNKVHIALPEHRFNQYPYELSGGMRQRVMLAIAFSCRPEVLIADEPTTALDVTVQAQILNIINDLKAELGTAVLLITHDLSVVAERCDRVVVMYAGQIVEQSSVEQLFRDPQHPYTKALLRSIPDVWEKRNVKSELTFLPGQPPKLVAGRLPAGCAFQQRCPERFDECAHTEPPLYDTGAGHYSRCLLLAPKASETNN